MAAHDVAGVPLRAELKGEHEVAAEYVITVVDRNGSWRNATGKALVTAAGVPLGVAARWATVRRTMSPRGLKRKAREARN